MKRLFSGALATLTVFIAVSSALIPVSAEVFALGVDTQQSSNEDYTTLMSGIDISGWQTSVNWTNVKNAGVEFAMLRLTSYSSESHSYVKDPMLDSHINGAKSQGIHIGAYFFSYAKSVQEVRDEANMVLDIINQYPETFDFPIVFDAESTNIQGFAADACIAFKEILEANGYYVSIYANKNWLDNIITPSIKIAGIDIWQAYYPWNTETQTEKYKGYTPTQAKAIDFNSRKAINNNNRYVYMWQLTQYGTVSGIGSNCVDIDICTLNYPQIIRAVGLNGFPKPDIHTHIYRDSNDATNHYQTCYGCADRQNVVEHSYSVKYSETQHWLECSCQYKKNVAKHSLKYVDNGDTHTYKCDCGYVQGGGAVAHSYTILESNENEHYYRCECGKIDATRTEAHKLVDSYDADHHYKKCEVCEIISDESKQAHSFDISTNYEKCVCGYDRSTVDDGHNWEIGYDKEQHYHICKDEGCEQIRPDTQQEHIFDRFYIENSYHGYKCVCGYSPEEMQIPHSYNIFSDGENGHRLECVCGDKSELEEHTFEDGKCTVCDYSAKVGSDTEDEKIEPIVDGEKDTSLDVSAEGCGASIAATATVLCVSVFGCALGFKKKED